MNPGRPGSEGGSPVADKIRVTANAFGKDLTDRSSSNNSDRDEIVIPEDFQGVIQVNIQDQHETQNQNTNVALTAMQTQITTVTVMLQGMQGQLAQLLAMHQGAASQLQLLFLTLVGGAAGSSEVAAERQQLLRELVQSLRRQPEP
jgi:hypothetical protein